MKQIYYTTKSYFPREKFDNIDEGLARAGYLHLAYNDKPLLFCPDKELEEFKKELQDALGDKVILEKV